jgi:N6-adenosine-specific RNA methylase IME4
MIDRELLDALSDTLRVEIEENITRKDFTQSELAEIQAHIITYWSAVRKQRQGARTDLTSTQTAVEVERPKRVENTTEQVARLFGESEHTTRKRLAIVEAAKAEPERFNKLVADMDRSGHVNGVHRRLSNILQGDRLRAAPPPLPTGPFHVAVADPPWPFEIRMLDPSRRAVCPYPTMTVADICALPIGELMADDSILWLWTTNVHLLNGSAQQVLNAWGFTPKTMLTWAKDRFGTGDWLRGQTEHAILAVRGNPVKTLTNQSTLLYAPMRAHSEKPDEFYALVEELCPAPAGGKVDIFARKARPGWVPWGDEAPKAEAAEYSHRQDKRGQLVEPHVDLVEPGGDLAPAVGFQSPAAAGLDADRGGVLADAGDVLMHVVCDKFRSAHVPRSLSCCANAVLTAVRTKSSRVSPSASTASMRLRVSGGRSSHILSG